jgi:hypothetical protein
MVEGDLVNTVMNMLVPKYEGISCLTQQVLDLKEGYDIWN